MIFVLFIILLTFANTAYGLYLAVRLGYGPPTMKDVFVLLGLYELRRFRGWSQITELLHFPESFQTVKSQFTGNPIVFLKRWRGIVEGFFRRKETEESVADQDSSQNMEDMLIGVSEANLSDLLDDESDRIGMVAPLREFFDDDLANVLKAKGTETWFMGEKHVETSILKLNSVIIKSGIFSAQLDSRLRAARGTADAHLAQNSMADLRNDCANYLAAQAELTAKMKKRIDEFGELAHLAEEIEYSNMEQAAQIETTINNVDRMNPGAPEETVSQLLKELSKLRFARHRLRDQQEKAFLTMVRYEKRMDMIVPQLFVDEISGLRCRIGLEVTLHEWWKQNRQETRQICFALLDLVKFGEINDEYGIIIADKLIAYVGDILEKDFTSHDLTGIYYGNCFFIVTVNMGLRKTVSEIEKIRQGLERTNFICPRSDPPLSVKITSTVTEILPQHTEMEVMQLMEKSIIQAKKMSRGFTYLLDQGKLNPELEKVDLPNLGMDYITIKLDVT